jgi:hypothetical protein
MRFMDLSFRGPLAGRAEVLLWGFVRDCCGYGFCTSLAGDGHGAPGVAMHRAWTASTR